MGQAQDIARAGDLVALGVVGQRTVVAIAALVAQSVDEAQYHGPALVEVDVGQDGLRIDRLAIAALVGQRIDDVAPLVDPGAPFGGLTQLLADPAPGILQREIDLVDKIAGRAGGVVGVDEGAQLGARGIAELAAAHAADVHAAPLVGHRPGPKRPVGAARVGDGVPGDVGGRHGLAVQPDVDLVEVPVEEIDPPELALVLAEVEVAPTDLAHPVEHGRVAVEVGGVARQLPRLAGIGTRAVAEVGDIGVLGDHRGRLLEIDAVQGGRPAGAEATVALGQGHGEGHVVGGLVGHAPHRAEHFAGGHVFVEARARGGGVRKLHRPVHTARGAGLRGIAVHVAGRE